MADKERILEELSKEDLQVLALAYMYAKNIHMYGVDVTQASCTATEHAKMLDEAYRKGYYDAMKQIEERNCYEAEIQPESDIKNDILDKIRVEIGRSKTEHEMQITENIKAKLLLSDIYCDIANILDKYKEEVEMKNEN